VLHLKGKVLDRLLQFINAEYPWSESHPAVDFQSKIRNTLLSFGNLRRDRNKRGFNGGEFARHCFPKGHSSRVEHF